MAEMYSKNHKAHQLMTSMQTNGEHETAQNKPNITIIISPVKTCHAKCIITQEANSKIRKYITSVVQR